MSFATPIDATNPDNEPLGYYWPNIPVRAFHIAVQEKNCKSVREFLTAFCDAISTHRTIKYSAPFVLEGLHWTPFNTADTDNFRVTQTPSFSDPEITGFPVEAFGNTNTISIFVMPRKDGGSTQDTEMMQ